MASIESNIDDIRNAVYGREVRTAIADSIEQINSACTEESSRAQSVEYVIQHNLVTLEDDINGDISNVVGSLSVETERAIAAENSKIDRPEVYGTPGQVLTVQSDGSIAWEDPADPESKIDKPETDGTTGQVLTVQSDGSIAWEDPADPESKIDKPETDGTTGQVLTVQSDGSIAWEDPAEFSTDTVAQAVSDWLDEHPSATIDLGDNSIASNMIENNAVTSDKINGNAVTTAKIANGSVTADKLANSGVTTAKIVDSAVTSAKLASASVTSAKLGSASVTTEKLNNGSVTTEKLNNGSVTDDKLSTDLKKAIVRGGSITPLYVGGYLTEEEGLLPACCLKIGNYFYAIDCKHWYYATDNGLIRKFDTLADEKDESGNVTTQHNKEITSFQKRIKVGHANSIAYDTVNGKIYIAPVWDQSTGTNGTFMQKLYVYNTSFTYQNDITTPRSVMGVSYDHVTSSLYCYCYRNTGTQIHEVYKLVNNSWVLYTTINLNDIIQCEDYNQDFAVYNNRFFISSPRGNMLTGILKQGSGESKVMTAFVVTNFDSTGRFRLGELEGMEFDPDGHLYANSFITFISHEVTAGKSKVDIKDYTNACIIELPVGIAKAEDLNHVQGNVLASLKDNTLTLSELTKIRFRLNTWELRSISQLSARLDHSYFTRISIASGNNITENYNVSIKQNIELYLAGNYTAKSLSIYAGLLSIYTDNSTHALSLTASNYLINLYRSASLKICGSTSLRVATPNLTGTGGNNFINIGYYNPIVIIRTTPTSLNGKTFYLGSYKLTNTGLFCASKNMSNYCVGETIIYSGYNHVFGYVTTNSTVIRLDFILDKNVPTDYSSVSLVKNPDANGTDKLPILTIRGLFPDSNISNLGKSISIDLNDTTSYSTLVSAYGNVIRLAITSKNNQAFKSGTYSIINNTTVECDPPPTSNKPNLRFLFN